MAIGNLLSVLPRQQVARDQQRISTEALYTLLIAALVPVLIATLRLMALMSTEPGGVLALGEWLNRHLQLSWVGYLDRDVVLYILLLPVAALLTAITRLTLGVRVLGFRAILIAIGMQEIGVLPCLLLILIIAVTVVVVRPLMRRSGLPLFARVAVILCIVALIMVAGLLSGASLNSPTLWSMAFFPVVILAMLAESIAKTVANESTAVAVWRTLTTIALALVIAGAHQLTLLQQLMMNAPELIVSVLVMIVLVAEFLDLRLLENFRPGVKADDTTNGDRPKIVILRNRFPEAPVRHRGVQAPRRYRRASLQPVVDGLRNRGLDVTVLEADTTLPASLAEIGRSAHGPNGAGMAVLNFAGGVQGTANLAQAPTLCEMLGVAYSGPLPQAPVMLGDRLQQVSTLQAAGLRVPVGVGQAEALRRLHEDGPSTVWVGGRFAADHTPREVRDPGRFERICDKTARAVGELHFEIKPAGRLITVVVLHPELAEAVQPHNGKQPQVLPLIERDKTRGTYKAASRLSANCRQAVEAAATRAASALGCRDCARIDVYCTAGGVVTIARVSAVNPITRRGACAHAASLAGLSVTDLAMILIDAVLLRETSLHGSAKSVTRESMFDAMSDKPQHHSLVKGVTSHG